LLFTDLWCHRVRGDSISQGTSVAKVNFQSIQLIAFAPDRL
jgi:hypothetical protein